MSSASVRFGTKAYVCARYFLRPGKRFKYILIDEDDSCENHTKNWMDSLMEKFIRKSMR